MSRLEKKLIDLGYEPQYITKTIIYFVKNVKSKPIIIQTNLDCSKIKRYYVRPNIPTRINSSNLLLLNNSIIAIKQMEKDLEELRKYE